MRALSWETVACILLLGFSACINQGDEVEKDRLVSALESASNDLAEMGLKQSALRLQERAYHHSNSIINAESALRLCKETLGEQALLECYKRLSPSTPFEKEELETRVLEESLKGWEWKKVKILLEKNRDDPRLAMVEDILSRTTIVRDSFNGTLFLNWKNKGWSAGVKNNLFELSQVQGRSQVGGVYCPVGWNGEGFKMSMDLCVTKLNRDDHLIWGLSAREAVSAPDQDAPYTSILFSYADGKAVFQQDGRGLNDFSSMHKKWRLPLGCWLQIKIEYLPQNPLFEGSDAKNSNAVRAWVFRRNTNERLLCMDLKPATGFSGGSMLAGFFSGRNNNQAHGRCVLHADNFAFEN